MADLPKGEEINFALKVAGYVTGIALGLGAKLAVENKKKSLTLKDFVYHGAIAFASAWLVWWALARWGQLDAANLVSVVVGRYGDVVLIAAYNKLSDFLGEFRVKTPKDKP